MMISRSLSTLKLMSGGSINTGCNINLLNVRIRDRFHDLYPNQEDLSLLLSKFSQKYPPHSQLRAKAREIFWPFLTKLDTAALLNMHEMQVLDKKAVDKVLMAMFGETRRNDLKLLDVGSGAGGAILPFTAFFDEVICTDSSFFCVHRARRKGLHCLQIDDLSLSNECAKEFDLITLQNVLDRCSHPLTLLRQAIARLKKQPKGILLISLSLPFQSFVSISPISFLRGSKDTGIPVETLAILGDCWEQCVNSAVFDIFQKEGLELEYLTRVPYLCQAVKGNPEDFYFLDNAVFVLKKASTFS